MAQHKLTIDPGGGGETVYNAGKISALDFDREHTAIGDWKAEVPYDLSLENRIGDEIHIEEGTSFLFRGYLREVENKRDSNKRRAQLRGKGIGFDLTRDQTERNPTNIKVHDEIANVWGLTNFSDTTTAPSANNTTSDESVQEANTDSEFNSITGDLSNDPAAVQNSNVELLQSTGKSEGENFDRNNGTAFNDARSGHSGSGYEEWGDNGDWAEYDLITPNYTIPADQVDIHVLFDGTSTVPEIDWILNGESLGTWSGLQSGDDWVWRNITNTGDISRPSSDLQSGATTTLRIEETDETSGTFDLDAVVIADRRYSYTFTEGDLSATEDYPDSHTVTFNQAATTWSVNSADLSTSWDDTSNNQRIQMRLPPSGSWGPTDGSEDNTSSITNFGFGSDNGTAVQGRARLSRYNGGSSGQKLQSWEIKIDGDDVPVITDEVYEGSHFDILQELHDEGRMNWTIKHEKNAKNAESYPINSQSKSQPDWTVLGQTRSKSLRRGYANHVTVRGATDSNGNRIKQTVSDQTEINNNGKEHIDVKKPQADTQTKVDRIARQILERRLTNADRRGRQEVVAINIDPGFSYPVDWSDGTQDTIPAELVHYEIREGDLVGVIEFDLDPAALGPKLSGTDRDLQNTQLAF